MRRRSSYTPRPRDTNVGVDEPCTISADVVAEYLDRRGMVRMASFVRALGRDDREKNVMEQQFAERYNALLARLHAYEPPPEPCKGPVWTGD